MEFLPDLPDSTFALAGLIGLAAVAFALLARWAETRRLRRKNPDAVGFMPWTGIYFVALLVACIELGMAVRMWFAH